MTSSLRRGFAAKGWNIFELSSYLETAEEAAYSCRDTFFSRSRATLTTTKGYSCYSYYYQGLLLLLPNVLLLLLTRTTLATSPSPHHAFAVYMYSALDCGELNIKLDIP